MDRNDNVITIEDDSDEVRIRVGDTSLTTSGRVIRLLLEDMFGSSVDWYIQDATLGRMIRIWQRRMDQEKGRD